MTTVDHRSSDHNCTARAAKPAGPPQGRQSRFAPCRAIGGAQWAYYLDDPFVLELLEPAPDFVVGVVDTGIVVSDGELHPALLGHIRYRSTDIDPTPAGKPLRPDDGHGTFVCGVILREAPNAIIRVARAIDRDLFDHPGPLTEPEREAVDRDVAAAINRLAAVDPESGDAPANVINLSFCGELWEDPAPDGIGNAIESALAKGIVVIAAAGNDPRGAKLWPGAFAARPEFGGMYTVGAVDETALLLDAKTPPVASFSNRGEWVTVYANGVDVLGPYFDRADPSDQTPGTRSSGPGRADRGLTAGSARWSGTSFATAIVTGAVARSAISDRSRSTREIAESMLTANSSIPGLCCDSDVRCWIKAVDSSWELQPGLPVGR